MKIELLTHDDRTLPCERPYETCDYVTVEVLPGHADCDDFGELDDTRMGVYGTEINRGHNTYTSRAFCKVCNGAVGMLRVTVDTLFGIEEDERMLGSAARWRVY